MPQTHDLNRDAVMTTGDPGRQIFSGRWPRLRPLLDGMTDNREQWLQLKSLEDLDPPILASLERSFDRARRERRMREAAGWSDVRLVSWLRNVPATGEVYPKIFLRCCLLVA